MRELLDDYLRQGAAEGWSQRTQHIYRHRLEGLLAFLRKRGRNRLAGAQPKDIDSFMLYLVQRGIGKNTRFGYASTTRAFFRWLAEAGRVLANPARDIALPDDGEPDLPAPPLEEHEIAQIFDSLPRRNVIDLRNRLHMELLYGCALRIEESVNLNVHDLSLPNRTVHVRGGKGGKDRLLPLVRGVAGALKDYMALRRSLLRGPDHGALLLARNGQRLNVATFRVWLRQFNQMRARKLGVQAKRIHPHLLRHSIAVHLLRGGADIRHVQEFLGHARLDTTKIYLRLVPGRLKEDYDKAMPEIDVKA